MDIHQLKTFVEVAHQGNLTQAAETLCLSQPAVTAQIKTVERNLDVVLFERTAQGVRLTAAGEAFLPKAELMLQNMHELDVFAAKLSTNYIAQATVGVVEPVLKSKVSQMCHQILAQLPEVVWDFKYGVSGEVLAQVRKKAMHGGFFVGNNPYRNVYSIFLEKLRYVVIAPQSMLPEISRQNSKILNKLPWLDMPSYSAGSKITRQFWRKHKILPNSVLTCDKISVNVAMCASGLGLALVPESIAADAIQSGREVAVLSDLETIEELHFIYPNEFEEDYITQGLVSAVKTVWQVD